MNRRVILVALDLGPQAGAVLSDARDLAATMGAELVAAHCLDLRDTVDGGEAACLALGALGRAIAQRQAQLDRLCERVLGEAVGTGRVVVGNLAPSVLALIEELGAELLVMGAGRLRLLPLCGASEQLARQSPVPVVLVPRLRAAAPARRSAREAPRPRLRLVK